VLGHRVAVPQRPQVPVGATQRLRHLPEGQQAVVGVGPGGEPAQHRRQQLPLDLGLSAHPLAERFDVPQRGPRIGVPERPQPRLGRLGGEPDGLGRDPRDRLQQRGVEQPLVQHQNPPGGGPPQVHELLRVRQPEAAGQPAEVHLVLRHQVGAPQAVQLDAVLQQPLQAVGGGQVEAVRASDVAVVDQRPQRLEGSPQPQALVRPPVHQLQQLDAELDVPQTAGTELDLVVGFPGGQQGDHPAAHRLGLDDELVVLRDPPHHRPHHVDEVLRQGEVAGHRPGFEHRLELPVLGPPLVVGAVGGEGAHERAGLAFGSKRCIDLPDGARRGVRRAHPGERPGQLRAHGHRPRRLAQRGAVHIGGRLSEVEDVDVADVVEFPRSGLAESDDAEPADLPAGHLAAGEGQRRLHGGVGQVGQFAGDVGQLGQRVGGGQVTGGDPQQGDPVGPAQPIRRGRVGDWGGGRGVRPDGGQQFGAQRVRGSAGDVPDQRVHVAGLAAQVLVECHARTEHPRQPERPRQVGGQVGDQVRPRRHQPVETGQGQVGIRGAGQSLERRDGVLGRGDRLPALDDRRGAGRIAEPQPGEAAGQGIDPGHVAMLASGRWPGR